MGIVVHASQRTFTRDEYYKMAEAGVLAGERVELIDGEIVRMSPQNSPHAGSISKTNMVLVASCGETHIVRVQLPLTLSDICEPEPDFALVTSEALETALQAGRHPHSADLVLEIADSSLRYDRIEKASLYARAGIQDYWVLDLQGRVLLVHRQPAVDGSAPFGYAYQRLEPYQATDEVRALCRPEVAIAIARLL